MATVHLPSGLTQYTGGADSVVIEAPRLAELMAALRDRFPQIADQLDEMAVAIDGEIYQDPGYQARLLAWYTRPAAAIPPVVGSGQKNYWGISDLHGSIWEWVADFQTTVVTGTARGDQESDRERFCGGVRAQPASR